MNHKIVAATVYWEIFAAHNFMVFLARIAIVEFYPLKIYDLASDND